MKEPQETLQNILAKLKAPMQYQWKIQTKPTSDKKGLCVAYIDSRDVQDRLDEVCGVLWSENTEFIAQWENMVEYKSTISINIQGQIHSRTDIGSFEIEKYNSGGNNNAMAHKGASSDAFKRAAVKWGVGRFLYDLGKQFVTLEEYKANQYNLSKFINSRTR